MTDSTKHLMKLVALEMSLIKRKQTLVEKGFMNTLEYEAVCDDLKAIELMKEHFKLIYDTATRRLDKPKNRHEIERDKRIAENLGKNPF